MPSLFVLGPILMVGIMTAVSSALPGTILVIQRKALLSDAVSHSVLPGIVIAFMLVEDLNSPWLILGAGLMGVLLVFGVEALERTNLVKNDAALGLIFPALFSVGILMISTLFSGIHLDNDVVMMGDVALASLDRLILGGTDLGPTSFWNMLILFLANGVFLAVFYKEIKLGSFDPKLASQMGLHPTLIQGIFVLLASLTLVGTFNSAGAVLVVAFFILPGATASMLFHKFHQVLLGSLVIAALGAFLGVLVAASLDFAVSGIMAVVLGFLFLLTWLFAQEHGVISKYLRGRSLKVSFAVVTLLRHLHEHQDLGDCRENHVNHLEEHLNWSGSFARKVLEMGVHRRLLTKDRDFLYPTPKGMQYLMEFNQGHWPLAQ
jgi:manganese/zinc/iron transport system permease protein